MLFDNSPHGFPEELHQFSVLPIVNEEYLSAFVIRCFLDFSHDDQVKIDSKCSFNCISFIVKDDRH